ncbi:TetR family transcriptional regulator [Rhodococcus opacus]|uniref:TetR/AcrR family transcriptional regulator n=1 Tax=Rhodococcus opacus TaxID=37919 RepID=UPI001FF288BD|nr:TetR family transcriptional regulator [Rhodococcus opacus]UOT03261.1 TetR family transcriptional regulator [Rhodococcus opacus]
MVSVEAGSKQRTSAFGAGRQALIEATITVVARAGLRNLTYRAVAKEAGVAHGLVAHHFGSRQALIEAALQHALDESADVLSAVTEGSSLDTFVDHLAELASSEPDMQAFQYELILESRRNDELAPLVRMLYQRYRDATADALVRVGIARDDALTLLVFAALDGLVFQQIAIGDVGATEHALGKLRQILAGAR